MSVWDSMKVSKDDPRVIATVEQEHVNYLVVVLRDDQVERIVAAVVERLEEQR